MHLIRLYVHALIFLDGVTFAIQFKQGFTFYDEKELLRLGVLVQRLGCFWRHRLANNAHRRCVYKLPSGAAIAPMIGFGILGRLFHTTSNDIGFQKVAFSLVAASLLLPYTSVLPRFEYILRVLEIACNVLRAVLRGVMMFMFKVWRPAHASNQNCVGGPSLPILLPPISATIVRIRGGQMWRGRGPN